jgi:cyclopropane fatty-acyl-phospholipid synthase-like methyltransferase
MALRPRWSVVDKSRFYEAPAEGAKRSAPAALRNREPITDVLRDWLPERGLVLEIASGTGEHVVHFARAFPQLDWQPTDLEAAALASIEAWRASSGLPNIRVPLRLDAASSDWPCDSADAVLSINMVHISPWAAAVGLAEGAARILPEGGALVLYGPWLKDDIATAPSNLAFDADLKRRDPQWGLRRVEEFAAMAAKCGLGLIDTRSMPANNLMLLFRRNSGGA